MENKKYKLTREEKKSVTALVNRYLRMKRKRILRKIFRLNRNQ